MDKEFAADRSGLVHALSLLTDLRQNGDVVFELPDVFPEVVIGARAMLAPSVLGGACRLDAPTAFAYMDPPTPWLTWANGAMKLFAEPEPSSSRHCARCAAHRREGNRLTRAVLQFARESTGGRKNLAGYRWFESISLQRGV
jgi:hypothetical protein